MDTIRKNRAVNVNYLVLNQCDGSRAEFDRRLGGKKNMARRIINQEVGNLSETTLRLIYEAFDLSPNWLDKDHGHTFSPQSFSAHKEPLKGGDEKSMERIYEMFLDLRGDLRQIKTEISFLNEKCADIVDRVVKLEAHHAPRTKSRGTQQRAS